MEKKPRVLEEKKPQKMSLQKELVVPSVCKAKHAII